MSETVTTPAAAPAASTPETKGGGTSATTAPSGGATTPTPPPKHKFDFDGTEREYTVEELRANYLKGRNAAQLVTKADQRWREIQEKERKAEESEKALRMRGKRVEALKARGFSDAEIQEIAEEVLLPIVQAQTLNEDQRRALEAERRANEYETKLKDREAKEREAEEERLAKEHQSRLGRSFVAALDRLGLPEASAPWAIKRMAALAEKAEDLGLEIPPDDLAMLVREDFLSEHRSITNAMTGEQLEALYGEEFVKKIIRYGVDKKLKKQKELTQKPAPGVVPAQKPNGSNGKKSTTMNSAQFDEYVKQLVKQGG